MSRHTSQGCSASARTLTSLIQLLWRSASSSVTSPVTELFSSKLRREFNLPSRPRDSVRIFVNLFHGHNYKSVSQVGTKRKESLKSQFTVQQHVYIEICYCRLVPGEICQRRYRCQPESCKLRTERRHCCEFSKQMEKLLQYVEGYSHLHQPCPISATGDTPFTERLTDFLKCFSFIFFPTTNAVAQVYSLKDSLPEQAFKTLQKLGLGGEKKVTRPRNSTDSSSRLLSKPSSPGVVFHRIPALLNSFHIKSDSAVGIVHALLKW